jgi:hypothetical protein
MEIPQALLDKWSKLRSHGDGKKIVEAAAEKGVTISDAYISRAFANGECSDEVFEAMASYFKEKEEKVNSFL